MAKKQNVWLAQMEEMWMQRMVLVSQWAQQAAFDAVTLVLTDPQVMGKDTFGPKRLKKLNVAANEKANEIIVGITRRPEASHVRRLTDDALKKTWGEDEFLSWEERYENWDDRGI